MDGHLELKADHQYVNLRAHVQLKATDSERTNNDGSVSLPIRVNNLRYLLNGPSPLYVLFVAPRNELRYVWARDEQRRLAETNPAWEKQDEVTLWFANILDAAALDDIYEQVRKEAQLQANVADILSKASNVQSVAINIDRATLQITDPEAAKRTLLASGTLIVTAGLPERVERLAGLLDPETARLPGILLVRAYTEHVSGRFRIASARGVFSKTAVAKFGRHRSHCLIGETRD